MILTFAFHGFELWCPWCGAKEGIFNGCEKVEATPVLEAREAEDKARSIEYLTAVSSLSCDQILHDGKWVSPSELPPNVIEQYRKTRAAWQYPVAANKSLVG